MQFDKKDFVDFLCLRLNLTKKQSKEIYEVFVDFIQDCLTNGDTVSLYPIGKFKFYTVPAKKARTIHFDDERGDIYIPDVFEHSRIVFAPTRKFKETISTLSYNHPFKTEKIIKDDGLCAIDELEISEEEMEEDEDCPEN